MYIVAIQKNKFRYIFVRGSKFSVVILTYRFPVYVDNGSNEKKRIMTLFELNLFIFGINAYGNINSSDNIAHFTKLFLLEL